MAKIQIEGQLPPKTSIPRVETNLCLRLSKNSIYRLEEASANLYNPVYSDDVQPNRLMYQLHHTRLADFYADIYLSGKIQTFYNFRCRKKHE